MRQGTDAAVADREFGWIERLPAGVRPFAVLARWDRPIGTWLLLLPCWWSAVLAPGGEPLEVVGLFLLFGLGAIAMRGAGCTLNDLFDRDLDRQVARTQNRPLAAGRLAPAEALVFIALQCMVGLFVLWFLNPLTIVLCFVSVPLVALYPLAKRVTWWPQAVLGITFNWGALVGYAAVTGEIGLAAIALYAGGFFWTLGYDTIYAHQDKSDDELVGVKSSALRLGERTRPWLYGFYAAFLLLLAASGWLAGLGPLFYLGLAAVGAHLVWQLETANFDDAANCLVRFRSNRDLGLLVLAALLMGKIPL